MGVIEMIAQMNDIPLGTTSLQIGGNNQKPNGCRWSSWHGQSSINVDVATFG